MATSKQAELLKEIQEVRKIVQALQHAETARVERESSTAEMFHHLTGNGKPGFMASMFTVAGIVPQASRKMRTSKRLGV